MKKIKLFLSLILAISATLHATNYTVETVGMTFSPANLTINSGDSVTFVNTSGYHNVNGTISTFPSNPSSFSNPSGVTSGWTYIHVFTLPGTYSYQCDPHLPGMVGSIVVNPSVDCKGVANGPALTDTCGTCHQAYIYDFVTHSVTFINDTIGITLGSTETIVMPNNPMNPYWNDCSLATNSIYDIVSNSPDHTTLKAAIDACSLESTLKGAGPFTLFAPTNAAFDALPAGTLTSLLNDIPQLTNILMHHVVGDSVVSTSLANNMVVTTLNTTDVTVTINGSTVNIDNATVTAADVTADNGVVHIIDAVLLPPTTTGIDNYNEVKRKYLYSLNILGKKVSKDVKNQIIFDIYENGFIDKRFNR